MSDTDDGDLNEDLERQLRFVRNAFNLSDEKMEELKQEYGSLEELLDDIAEYGDRAETLLDDTNEGRDESATNTEGAEVGSDRRERLDAWDLDVVSIDGRDVVPADEVNQHLRRLDRQIAEAHEHVERINEILTERDEAGSEFDIDVEEERRNIEEQWQRINDAKERIGLPTPDNPSTGQNKSWTGCTVDKAYKSQEKLLEDSQLCALGPEFAEELGLEEGEELRVRRADQPKKSAVYTVNEIREQDAQVRISNKGRKRLNSKSSFEAEVLPLNQ